VVLAYAAAHPTNGYCPLTWQMIDADVAYLSESSVCRALNAADLGIAGSGAPRRAPHRRRRPLRISDGTPT
jgi:hypothetical protein